MLLAGHAGPAPLSYASQFLHSGISCFFGPWDTELYFSFYNLLHFQDSASSSRWTLICFVMQRAARITYTAQAAAWQHTSALHRRVKNISI